MKEYQKFQPNSVNGRAAQESFNEILKKKDDRIVVTTIQKLNKFITANPNHEIYSKKCVLIFDECHRQSFRRLSIEYRQVFRQYTDFRIYRYTNLR